MLKMIKYKIYLFKKKNIKKNQKRMNKFSKHNKKI